MSRTKSSHKLRWFALILAGLLIIVLAGAFFWWQHYKTTPAYSLALLVDAAQRNDDAAFDRLIDMQKVLDNFMPQVLQTAAGGVVSDVANSVRTQIQSLAPGVMATFKETLKEEIRKRINELAGSSGARPFFLTALAIPFKAKISESDETAKALIDSGDHQVELSMERIDGSYWRVTSLRDDELATRVADNILKDLPGSGSQLDKEVQKHLRENLRKLPLLP